MESVRRLPYYHRRLALKQRTHQLFNVRAGVLVVGVGVDDDVCAQAQTMRRFPP